MCWRLQAHPSPSPSSRTIAAFIRGKRQRWSALSASPDPRQRLVQCTHTHSIYGGTVCEVFSRALINHDLQLLQALFIFFHACIETLLQLPHVQIHTNVSFAFFTCQPVSSSLNKNDVMIKSSAFFLFPLWFYIRGLVTWCTVLTFLSRLLSLM